MGKNNPENAELQALAAVSLCIKDENLRPEDTIDTKKNEVCISHFPMR
jgi:hypothetical protein